MNFKVFKTNSITEHENLKKELRKRFPNLRVINEYESYGKYYLQVIGTWFN